MINVIYDRFVELYELQQMIKVIPDQDSKEDLGDPKKDSRIFLKMTGSMKKEHF